MRYGHATAYLFVMAVFANSAAAEDKAGSFDRCGASIAVVRQQRDNEADAAATAGIAVMEARAAQDQLRKTVDDNNAKLAETQKALDAANANVKELTKELQSKSSADSVPK